MMIHRRLSTANHRNARAKCRLKHHVGSSSCRRVFGATKFTRSSTCLFVTHVFGHCSTSHVCLFRIADIWITYTCLQTSQFMFLPFCAAIRFLESNSLIIASVLKKPLRNMADDTVPDASVVQQMPNRKRFRGKQSSHLGISRLEHIDQQQFQQHHQELERLCKQKSEPTLEMTNVGCPPRNLEPQGLGVCRCKICGFECMAVRQADLLNHMRTHIVKQLVCCSGTNCGYQYLDKADFGKHMREHMLEMYTRDLQKRYHCIGFPCDFCSPSKLEFERHWWTHASGKPYMCGAPGCGFAAWRLDNIDPHMKTHVRGGQHWKRHRCIVHGCGFKGVHAGALNAHMLAIHACKDTLTCKVAGCDYTALSYNLLKWHMQIHTKVVSKECA